MLVEAGPSGPRVFSARFDEPVAPVQGSFAMEPGGAIDDVRAEGLELRLGLPLAQEPGADYSIAGEVEDSGGNRTRMVLGFCGWNERSPRLRISEVLTAKNSSKTRPHRDFIELVALSGGNIGGVELLWASSVKAYAYRFPAAELEAGDFVVLHLSPEGIPEERDEGGSDLSLSGGIDASPGGRDFWSASGALPDASGVVALRPRPGDPACDGLFYAEEAKTGALKDEKFLPLLLELGSLSLWGPAAAQYSWEDAFRWKPSSSRSICRAAAGPGPGAWLLSDSGGQSPGAATPPPAAGTAEAKRTRKSAKR
jgi:hypothetical protein